MFLRRSIQAVAAATALCAVTAPAAQAAAASDSAPGSGSPSLSATAAKAYAGGTKSGPGKPPAGLYGEGDPKYDGVWRQSLALLALDAAGAVPSPKAVDWLKDQQCEDGSFTAYRAKPGAACDTKKTPADTNATAAAVQALAAVGGEKAAVGKSVDWLRSVQNKDGGWGYNPGGPSDANSVSVVVGALSAAGERPEKTTQGGKSPYDALRSFQLGCDAKADERGAFAYQPGKDGELAANADATAAAVLAGLGSGMQTEPGSAREPEPLECGEDGEEGANAEEQKGGSAEKASQAGAAYLAAELARNKDHLLAATPGAGKTPDYANTADAVVALAAGGHRDQARKSLDWLAAKLGSWDKAKKDPAAIAAVMLAVHATGGDAAKLGDTKLLDRLVATGPEPARMPGGKKTAGGAAEDGESDVLRWSLLGAGLAAGAGVGFLISGRSKRKGL